jgi:SM-20-related protein
MFSTATYKSAKTVLIDNFLSTEELDALMEYTIQHQEDFESSYILKVGQGKIVHDNRRSLVLFKVGIHKEVITNRINCALPSILEQLGYQPFPISRIEAQITASNDGDFYKIHNDNILAYHTREISYVYYYYREPKAFTGGELCIYDSYLENGCAVEKNASKVILPLKNRIVFFPSLLAHEILPIYCPSKEFVDSRFTLNGWLHK